MAAQPQPALRPHAWIVLPVGRICRECLVVLTKADEDDGACPGGRGSAPPPTRVREDGADS
jgi:hypothetical protein